MGKYEKRENIYSTKNSNVIYWVGGDDWITKSTISQNTWYNFGGVPYGVNFWIGVDSISVGGYIRLSSIYAIKNSAVSELINNINNLPTDNFEESDVVNIYGAWSAYNALDSETKKLVSNYTSLVEVKNKFDLLYNVEVVYSATEAEKDNISGSGEQYNGEIEYGGIDGTYGAYVKYYSGINPTLKERQVQRISLQSVNWPLLYDCKLYTNIRCGSNTTLIYLNGVEWITYSDIKADIWTPFELQYNGLLTIGVKSTNKFIDLSPVYAVKKSNVSILIENINNLPTDNFSENDVTKIYGALSTYNSLSEAQKSYVTNYELLSTIKEKYDMLYDVKVIFDGTELGSSSIKKDYSGDNYKLELTYAVDATYGAYVQYKTGLKQKLYFDPVEWPSLTGYTLYTNISATNTGDIKYMTPTEWVFVKAIEETDMWYEVSYDYMLANLGVEKIGIGQNFKMTSIYAVKTK